MELKKIRSLLKVMEEANLSELELSEGESWVRLVRTPPQVPFSTMHSSPPPPSLEKVQEEGGLPAVAEAGGHLVTSPFVGTFYRSSSPGAKPLVEVGAMVHHGQVLCVVEAMKVMNEIESEHDGKVVEILAKNGQLVEYGAPLFRIEPA